jgi:hypothetical protein
MIVRILADNQYRIDDEHAADVQALDRLDRELMEALEANDDARFRDVLVRLIAHIRGAGQAVPVEEIVPSDMMVPAADMTLPETRTALASGVAGS